MLFKNITAAALCLLLLAGCQQQRNTTPPAGQQIKPLSTLIGAAQFLRDKCSRSDIPADKALAAAAVSEATRKGWSTATLAQTTLLSEAGEVSARLNADATPLTEKCSGLNRTLAPFLAQVH